MDNKDSRWGLTRALPTPNQVLIKVRAASLGLSSFTDQKFAQSMTKMTKPDLTLLGELLQAGKVEPAIERTYRSKDAPEAVQQLDAGRARHKPFFTVGEKSS